MVEFKLKETEVIWRSNSRIDKMKEYSFLYFADIVFVFWQIFVTVFQISHFLWIPSSKQQIIFYFFTAFEHVPSLLTFALYL